MAMDNTNKKIKNHIDLEIKSRESVLTIIYQTKNINFKKRFCFYITLIVIYKIIFHRKWEDKGFLYGFDLILKGYHDIFFALRIWFGMFICCLLVHPAINLWAYVRINNRLLLSNRSLLKLWDVIWLLFSITFILSILIIPLKLHGISSSVLSNISLTSEQIRFAVKMHVFIRTIAPKFLFINQKDKLKYPKFSNYLYFLFAPTFMYHDTYPRYKNINWKHLIETIIEFLLVFYLLAVLTDELILIFENFGKTPVKITSLKLLFIKTAFLSINYAQLLFYILFHLWLNIWAEILKYPDRQFYQTSADLVNLFASPAGRELIKYKPKAKTKYKTNPAAVDFFAHKTGIATSDTTGVDHKSGTGTSPDDASKGGANATISPGTQQTAPRRRSLDLYNEAAAILGLTCSQTNDCRCIECQCHYFDFDDDLDYSSDAYPDHQSMCSIQ